MAWLLTMMSGRIVLGALHQVRARNLSSRNLGNAKGSDSVTRTSRKFVTWSQECYGCNTLTKFILVFIFS